jgi:hypothetical protein
MKKKHLYIPIECLHDFSKDFGVPIGDIEAAGKSGLLKAYGRRKKDGKVYIRLDDLKKWYVDYQWRRIHH